MLEYGERIKNGLALFPGSLDCSKNLLVTQNHLTKICYKLTEEAKHEFIEWHDHVQKFTMGKDEKENYILKRHLNKAQ